MKCWPRSARWRSVPTGTRRCRSTRSLSSCTRRGIAAATRVPGELPPVADCGPAARAQGTDRHAAGSRGHGHVQVRSALDLSVAPGGVSYFEYSTDLFDDETADAHGARLHRARHGVARESDAPLESLPAFQAMGRQPMQKDAGSLRPGESEYHCHEPDCRFGASPGHDGGAPRGGTAHAQFPDHWCGARAARRRSTTIWASTRTST